MIKKLLAIMMILLIFTSMVPGCGAKNPLKGLNRQKIESITIKTALEGLPKQKITSKDQDIMKIIDFLKNLKLEKLEDQTPIKGWSFWFAFTGWDSDIILIEDIALIGGVYYQMPAGTQGLMQELYKDIGGN